MGTRVCRLGPLEMVMVFASSVDTTHRLCRLLQIINGQLSPSSSSASASAAEEGGLLLGGVVEELSRNLSDEGRASLLARAAKGGVRVLVSSDQVARGMDLPNVKLVVNYDAPSLARAYVHRVGRTARANRRGFAITLLKEGQAGAFKQMRSLIGYGAARAANQVLKKLPRCKPSKATEESMAGRVAEAIKMLPSSLGLAPSTTAEGVAGMLDDD